MNKTKRERQLNFSQVEESLLVELVLKNGLIIENKETDSEVWRKKSETWYKIDKAMVVSTGIQRGSKALKNKWEKIKREVKHRLAFEKKEMYKTGGGSAKKFKSVANFEQIVELLGVSAVGNESNFDCDFIELSNVELSNVELSNVKLSQQIEQVEQSPNLFEESFEKMLNEVNDVEIVADDVEGMAENTVQIEASTSNCNPQNWENWTPASLRQSKSSKLNTKKTKSTSGGFNKRQDVSKRSRAMNDNLSKKNRGV